MKKLLKLLMNAPVAIALAFLLVGAPSAPMAKMLPSSGDAMAACDMVQFWIEMMAMTGNSGGGYDYGPSDRDCDGIPDDDDPCPDNPDVTCGDSGVGVGFISFHDRLLLV